MNPAYLRCYFNWAEKISILAEIPFDTGYFWWNGQRILSADQFSLQIATKRSEVQNVTNFEYPAISKHEITQPTSDLLHEYQEEVLKRAGCILRDEATLLAGVRKVASLMERRDFCKETAVYPSFRELDERQELRRMGMTLALYDED